MRNWQRFFAVLFVILFCSELTLAKTDIHDWRNVRIIQIGSPIVVKTKQGEKYQGTLDYAGLDTISIVVEVPRVMRRIVKVPKDDVKEVRARFSNIASSAMGGAIGLGVGLGLGQIIDSKDRYGEDPGLGKLVMGFLGVVFGAALGRSLGFGKKKVYESV